MAQNNNLPSKILVVDDDPAVATGIENGLAKFQVTVVKAMDLESALYQFNQNRFDVVVVELDFGPLPGLALIQKWRNHEIADKRLTGFIALASGQRTNGQDGLAREMTDIEIITKPVKDFQLVSYLTKALANKQRAAAFIELKEKTIAPHIKVGNIDKAIARVQQMLNELGDKARKLMIEIYETAEQYDNCLNTCVKMLETTPNDSHIVSTAGRMCMKLGKFEQAKPYIEKADQLAPQHIDRLNALASLYLQTKEPEKSIAKFKELIELNPESPDYKFDVFKKLYDAGYDSHAVEFGKEIAQPMEIVRHYNNKGVLLAKEGKIKEALSEYERAVKFYPKYKENYRIYYNMALSHLQLKTKQDIELAKSCLQKSLELEPNYDKAKTSLANLQKLAS